MRMRMRIQVYVYVCVKFVALEMAERARKMRRWGEEEVGEEEDEEAEAGIPIGRRVDKSRNGKEG